MFFDFYNLFAITEITYPINIVKRLSVFLVAIIVVISGKDSLTKKDSVLLKLAFAAICSAELAFLFHSTYGGIGFFLVSQIMLIFRNGQGIKQKLNTMDKATKYKLIACGTAIFVAYGLILAFVFYPVIKLSVLFAAFIVYGSVLGTSLWTGIANYILKLFPKKNSIMVSIGMTCFFVSDILVGLVMIIKTGIIYQLADCFIWVLYTPAIILLAFSGYKYNESEPASISSNSASVSE